MSVEDNARGKAASRFTPHGKSRRRRRTDPERDAREQTVHTFVHDRNEPDRPQPRLDRDTGDGLAWTVGKVRECEVLDLRYLALTHNTLRGAASGAVLNGELLYVQGYLG